MLLFLFYVNNEYHQFLEGERDGECWYTMVKSALSSLERMIQKAIPNQKLYFKQIDRESEIGAHVFTKLWMIFRNSIVILQCQKQ